MRRVLYIAVPLVVLGVAIFWYWSFLWSFTPWHRTPAARLSLAHASLLTSLDEVAADSEKAQETLKVVLKSLGDAEPSTFLQQFSENLSLLRRDSAKVFKGCKRVLRKASKYEGLIRSAPKDIRKMAIRLREEAKGKEFSETRGGYEGLSDSLLAFAVHCEKERDKVTQGTKDIVSMASFHKETSSFVDSFTAAAESLPAVPGPELTKNLLSQLQELDSRFERIDRSIATYRSVIGEPRSHALTINPKQ